MNFPNGIHDKSKKYASRCVILGQHLLNERKEFNLSNQFIRSSTSIAANVIESNHASSKKDFIYKLEIAQREAGESAYWLELLYDSMLITKEVYESLFKDCEEVQRLLASIITSTKRNMAKN